MKSRPAQSPFIEKKKKQSELSETLSREQQVVDSGIEKLGEEIRQLEAKLEVDDQMSKELEAMRQKLGQRDGQRGE